MISGFGFLNSRQGSDINKIISMRLGVSVHQVNGDQ